MDATRNGRLSPNKKGHFSWLRTSSSNRTVKLRKSPTAEMPAQVQTAAVVEAAEGNVGVKAAVVAGSGARVRVGVEIAPVVTEVGIVAVTGGIAVIAAETATANGASMGRPRSISKS
jgi:hypothetical protein